MDPKQLNDIQKYLIKNTPVGETDVVIENYKKCVGSNMDQQQLKNQMKQYNEDHLCILKHNNNKFIVNKDSSEQDYYVDQMNKKKIQIDHIKQEITSYTDFNDVKILNEELLSQLNQQIKEYVKSYFKEQESSHQIISKSDGSFVIYISAKNFNFKNFFGGEWNSVWTIKNQTIEGEVQINCHYFENYNEDSNIQFNCDKKFNCTLKSNSKEAKEFALEIMNKISENEFQLQVSFQDYYSEYIGKQLKKLRKIISFNQTKMNWNKNHADLKQELKFI